MLKGPYVGARGKITGTWKEFSLQLLNPSVTLLHICAHPQTPPAKVMTTLVLSRSLSRIHTINLTIY